MTDKEKIKELLVGMASSEWCDNAAKRKIHNDILPLIDSLPEKPELTKFETELLFIMADYGVEKASDDDIRREANRLLKIAIENQFPYNNPSGSLNGEIENVWNKLSVNGIFSATKSGFSEIVTHFAEWEKHEWNEEDSRILGNLKSELTNLVARGLIKRETEDKYVSWLESLKPQDRKSYVKIDRKVLFKICDTILQYEGGYIENSCPENDSPYFVDKWGESFLKKVRNIRNNS